jgi:hypothetical protein
MFIISGKGDYDILSKYPENSFQEYELYLKTSDDCDINKFSKLPKHIKIVSVHQPTHVIINGLVKNFDITSTSEIGDESIKAFCKTMDFAKQCGIKKIVLHECMFDSIKSSKETSMNLLKERISEFLSKDLMICIETNVMWFDYCHRYKTLLNTIEDFKELRKILGKDLHITLDIEHINYTYLFKEFLKYNTNYNLDEINDKEFAKDFLEFAKENPERLTNAFETALKLFITEFTNEIEHIHINGSDYLNYFYPENKSFFAGEHLPIKYNSSNLEPKVQDKFDYKFIFNTLKILADKKINIVLEIAINNSIYNFHDKMIISKKILEETYDTCC